LAASKIGDTILDPFAGSGTVGRVAVELNRKAILNDLAYQELSEKRTRNVQRILA
jgi:DNA modification methylase